MRTAECNAAIERLSAYIADPTPDRGAVEAALRHIHGCPDCSRRVGHLTRALETSERDRLSCQGCEERLPEYMAALAAGQASAARWRQIALHLATCPHCSAIYADLADLSSLAQGQRGAEPAAYPAARLGFLRAAPPQPWFVDELGRLIVALTSDLVQAARAPALAAAGLKSGAQPVPALLLSVPDAAPDLRVTISAERMRADPARYTISVEVVIPSRGGWPNLGGSRVVLRHGDEAMETQLTDAFGKAIFSGIAEENLGRLAFEITPAAGAD